MPLTATAIAYGAYKLGSGIYKAHQANKALKNLAGQQS